jgi:hypothetical protein
MTVKLIELMPAVAAKLAADEEHRRECEATYCDRCGRPEPLRRSAERAKAFRDMEVRRVTDRIPLAYAGATLDAEWLAVLVGPETLARAHEAIGAPCAAFLGPPGSGKSSMAAAMFRASAWAEPSGKKLGGMRWVSSHQRAKARAGQPLGEGESPMVEMCLAASLLVLDELGGEDPRYASAVGEVLFERHAAALPTWVTTGVGPKEITARYGGGIARRVFEGAAVFRLAGRK